MIGQLSTEVIRARPGDLQTPMAPIYECVLIEHIERLMLVIVLKSTFIATRQNVLRFSRFDTGSCCAVTDATTHKARAKKTIVTTRLTLAQMVVLDLLFFAPVVEIATTHRK